MKLVMIYWKIILIALSSLWDYGIYIHIRSIIESSFSTLVNKLCSFQSFFLKGVMPLNYHQNHILDHQKDSTEYRYLSFIGLIVSIRYGFNIMWKYDNIYPISLKWDMNDHHLDLSIIWSENAVIELKKKWSRTISFNWKKCLVLYLINIIALLNIMIYDLPERDQGPY